MPNSMAMHRPLMSVSYSATLLEEGKWMQTMYLMRTPRGETKTSPAPAPFCNTLGVTLYNLLLKHYMINIFVCNIGCKAMNVT